MVLRPLFPWVEWCSTRHLLGVSFIWWVFCWYPSVLMVLCPLFPWVEWCSTHHLLGVPFIWWVFCLLFGSLACRWSFIHHFILLLADSPSLPVWSSQTTIGSQGLNLLLEWLGHLSDMSPCMAVTSPRSDSGVERLENAVAPDHWIPFHAELGLPGRKGHGMPFVECLGGIWIPLSENSVSSVLLYPGWRVCILWSGSMASSAS